MGALAVVRDRGGGGGVAFEIALVGGGEGAYVLKLVRHFHDDPGICQTVQGGGGGGVGRRSRSQLVVGKVRTF